MVVYNSSIIKYKEVSMKILAVAVLALALSACGTVRGTAGGFVEGVSKDMKSAGAAGEKLADRIKP
jgi:predicted small secreted protein